jgi:hypothetical protein
VSCTAELEEVGGDDIVAMGEDERSNRLSIEQLKNKRNDNDWLFIQARPYASGEKK